MSYEQIIRDTIGSLRAQADALETALADGVTQARFSASATLPVFDPDLDTPPVAPSVSGTRVQQDWCSLLLWAQLKSVNVRQRRGATKDESVEFATNAGFQDGRGWNRWLGWYKDEDGLRWMDAVGDEHLRRYYDAVGRALPADFA